MWRDHASALSLPVDLFSFITTIMVQGAGAATAGAAATAGQFSACSI